MIAGFIGKMGCLARGTLVKTINGHKPIEELETVLSYDFYGNIVSVPCGVLETKKKPYEITFEDGSKVVCSEEHEWFVSSLVTRSTNKLKDGDLILSFDGELQPKRKTKPCLERTRQQKNKETIPQRMEHNENLSRDKSFTKRRDEKVKIDEDTYKALENTTRLINKRARTQTKDVKNSEKWKGQPRIQTRQDDRTEGKQGKILIDRETGLEMGVLLVPSQEHEQELRLSCSSQGWKQHKQLSEQLSCFVPIVSRKNTLWKQIKRIKKLSEKPIIMYDLVVPNTNNFILGNGLLTHNSGKTLSMVREALKYHTKGYKIYSNFHLEIPYEQLDFQTLFHMAENQTPLDNVVILLDEVHILLDSRGSMKKENKVVSFWLNQTRKMKVKLYYTTQHLHQIDKRLRSGTDFFIFCEGIKYMKNDKEYFICVNNITDGDNIRPETFVGNKFFKYYDTNQVIGFMDSGFKDGNT